MFMMSPQIVKQCIVLFIYSPHCDIIIGVVNHCYYNNLILYLQLHVGV